MLGSFVNCPLSARSGHAGVAGGVIPPAQKKADVMPRNMRCRKTYVATKTLRGKKVARPFTGRERHDTTAGTLQMCFRRRKSKLQFHYVHTCIPEFIPELLSNSGLSSTR